MAERDRAHLLAALAQELAQSPTEQSTAAAVTSRAIAHVTDADSVSVTLRARRNRFVTLAASDDLSRRLDEAQYAVNEGPCLEAADGLDWYRSGDVGNDRRWPRWGSRARELGAQSLLSVRLLSAGAPIGALNFYSRHAGRFSDRDQIDFAILYATHVAVALTASRQVTGLETALHSRHIIGIAQGILSERFGLDVDRSFDLLRRYSSTTNTRLSTVAEDIVRTRRVPHQTEDSTGTPPLRAEGLPRRAASPPPSTRWQGLSRPRTAMIFQAAREGDLGAPVEDLAQRAIDATASTYTHVPATDVQEHLRHQLALRGIRAAVDESVVDIARQIRSGHHVVVGGTGGPVEGSG